MGDTTQEERDNWRERLEYPDEDDVHEFWRSGVVFDLLNDADRCAELEAENERLRRGIRGPVSDMLMLVKLGDGAVPSVRQVGKWARELRALYVDPPVPAGDGGDD